MCLGSRMGSTTREDEDLWANSRGRESKTARMKKNDDRVFACEQHTITIESE